MPRLIDALLSAVLWIAERVSPGDLHCPECSKRPGYCEPGCQTQGVLE